jgi:hypothetical protein
MFLNTFSLYSSRNVRDQVSHPYRTTPWLILRPWIWRQSLPPKRPCTCTGLHGVTSQKIALFIVTGLRT